MRIRDDDELVEPEFSMAPLIDIVFQLLIFFLLSSSWTNAVDQEKSLEIELPVAQSSSESTRVPEELVIDVMRDGRLSLAGRAIERDGLQAALNDAARGNPALPVTIRGDRLVHHEDIVAVMDACGLAGLSNLAVGTLDL